jgi:hypothetical protein
MSDKPNRHFIDLLRELSLELLEKADMWLDGNEDFALCLGRAGDELGNAVHVAEGLTEDSE